MRNEIFTIGDCCFRLIWPEEITPPDNFMKFRGGEAPVYTYTISVADQLPAPEGNVIARRGDILVLDQNGLQRRYIGVKGLPTPHACYWEESEQAARIILLPRLPVPIEVDTVFSSLLALERRQIRSDAMILHCAYVVHEGEAILFSAPSGTGKSTQAALWERYRGASVINGDRALIQKISGRWYARGWPVCGSSRICFNRDTPIRAVVNLSQSPTDEAGTLTPMQAFARLYSEITVNRWDRSSTLRVMELLEQLATEVPVYHLACTMNESAVEALEKRCGKAGEP